jgi:hypothetical protein
MAFPRGKEVCPGPIVAARDTMVMKSEKASAVLELIFFLYEVV